jgi:hypothetical protein
MLYRLFPQIYSRTLLSVLGLRNLPNCFLCAGLSTCNITADAIGTISIAVAVLLIHALRKPVTIMNAAITFLPKSVISKEGNKTKGNRAVT